MDGPPADATSSLCWTAVKRPIFIVGVERSGTTLLRALLGAHSGIAVSPETHFMRLAEAFGASERNAPEDFGRFWRALEQYLQLRAIAIDLTRVDDLIEDAGARDFRTVFAAMLAAQAERTGKRRVGEKTPGHEHYLDRLLDWFPDAKVIFIHRDPRACAASALQAPWVKAQLHPKRPTAPLMRRKRECHVAHKAKEWLSSSRIEVARRHDPRIISVCYEALIAAPESALEPLCAFLGEAFEPAMLEAKQAMLVDTNKDTLRWREWTVEHERRAAAPIAGDRLDSWRSELTRPEIGMLEGVCAEGMAAFGYAPTLPAAAHEQGRRQFQRVVWADQLEGSSREAIRRLLGAADASHHASLPVL
jgi:hypothetical protein